MTLVEKAMAYNRELRDALQLIYDELNQGQRKKIMRNPTIKALYERYGIGGNDE
nr:MAG TPA: Swi5-dependent recombination DNA repair protein activator [Caudoviricetes sp.]